MDEPNSAEKLALVFHHMQLRIVNLEEALQTLQESHWALLQMLKQANVITLTDVSESPLH